MIKVFLLFFEKYGLLFILLNCYGLLLPDLSQKVTMMELDLSSFNEALSGNNLKKQLLWLTPLFIYSYILMKRKKKILFGKRSYTASILIISFVFVIGISFLYNYNLLSIKRAIFQLVLLLVFSLAIYFSIKSNTTVLVINYFCIIILITCFLSILLGTGFTGTSFSAWAKTKNQLGSYILSASVLFIFIKQLYKYEVKFYRVKLFILFLLLVATMSKTAIFIFVFSFFLFKLGAHALKVIFNSLVAITLGIFILIPAMADLTGDVWNIAQYMEPDTLTGRGLIWSILYNDLHHNNLLWTGYGLASYFGTGVIPAALDDSYSFIRFLNSAHNGYLELLLQFGAIVTFLVILILSRLVNLMNVGPLYVVAITVFIHNITESSLLRDQHTMWALYLITLLIVVFIKNFKEKDESRNSP